MDVERRRDLDEIEAEDPGMPGNPPQAACTSRESSPPGFVGAVPGACAWSMQSMSTET